MVFQIGNDYGKYKRTWNKGIKTGISYMEGKKHKPESIKKITDNNARYWKGKRFSKEHKENLSINHADFNDDKSPNWKGDSVGFHTIHQWVSKHKGKPNKCDVCGRETLKYYDWANKDHKYRRVLDDYIRMCRSCHRKHDMKFNGYKKGDYYVTSSS